jgi:hypothetical protein
MKVSIDAKNNFHESRTTIMYDSEKGLTPWQEQKIRRTCGARRQGCTCVTLDVEQFNEFADDELCIATTFGQVDFFK